MHLSQPFHTFVIAVATNLVIAMTTAKAGVLITIDKSAQSMAVSVDGNQRWYWPVSTGRRRYDTPSGSFRPFRMEASHFSRQWDNAPMPHSIFFTSVGHAIHGTYESAYLGSAVSHGCVRLSTENATRLYELIKAEGMPNTRVVVTGRVSGGVPEAYYRNRPSNGTGFFGQNQSSFFGSGQGPYGQNPYGQNAYQQTSYGQNRYGQNSAKKPTHAPRNAAAPNGRVPMFQPR
jgi:lipoprotein-anchoring transpeptidase ErfK/SrfK